MMSIAQPTWTVAVALGGNAGRRASTARRMLFVVSLAFACLALTGAVYAAEAAAPLDSSQTNLLTLAPALALPEASPLDATELADLAAALDVEGAATAASGIPAVNASAQTPAAVEECTPAQASNCCLPRKQDQLWIISTRSLGCSAAVSIDGFRVWHYVDGRWASANVAEFLASDDADVPTTFFAHGNRIDQQQAFQLGWSVYSGIARQAPTAPPLRFVLWSWPSDRIQGGQLEDLRIKAARTNVGGYHLGWFLQQLNPQVRVNLMGYSFGARIVTGSLHLLGGGTIGQYVLAKVPQQNHPPYRAVLEAAALDNDWLLPGRRHGLALSQLEHLLLLNNSCDQALKRYAWLYCEKKKCGPQALGYTGFAGLGSLSPADRAKVRQIDACCYIGNKHDWSLYAGSGSLNASIKPYAFFLPVGK